MNLKRLLSEYTISIGKITLLEESSDNQVFLISNGERKILRVSKRSINDIEFELETIRFLIQRSFPTAMWLPTINNKSHILIDRKPAVFFDFIDGTHAQITPEKEPDLEQVYSVGLMLGKLHTVSENYSSKLERKRTIFTELERSLTFRKQFVKDYVGGEQYIDEVTNLLSWAKKQKVKTGLIHNDYRPDNVFFNPSPNIVGVIDFDWCCLGPLVKDLALALVEWSFPDKAAKPYKGAFETFLKGYNTTAPEKWGKNEELYHWIMFACLSDASTYFCDLISNQKAGGEIIKSYMYQKFEYVRELFKYK